MNDFIEKEFDIREKEGKQQFRATESPVRWINLDFFCNTFDNELTNHDNMVSKCGDTGYEKILDAWKEQGIIE